MSSGGRLLFGNIREALKGVALARLSNVFPHLHHRKAADVSPISSFPCFPVQYRYAFANAARHQGYEMGPVAPLLHGGFCQ